MICNGCGGLLGRDCFNAQECEWITQQMEIQAQNDQEKEYYDRIEAEHFEQIEREYYNKNEC